MAKIKRGDKIIIITGKDRNKTGVVERVIPDANRAIVTGLNMVKKHLKRSQKYPQGGIIDKESSIHLSNLMLLDPNKGKPTRVGYRIEGKTKIRIGKISNENLDKKQP